jgi:arsenate reductase-like glutaredoxin family protein
VNTSNKKEGGENVNISVEKVNRALELNFGFIPMVNAEGLRETIEKVRESLYMKDSPTSEYYLEEVYADHAIYTKVDFVVEDETKGYRKRTGEQLYKQSYSLQDGKVVWGDQTQKVVRKISYVNVNKEEVKKMCEPCKEKVNALIANANTHYTESDREWLEALSEDKLDKMIPKVVKVNVDTPVTQEKALEVLGIAKEQYEKGLEIYNNRRKEVITNIIANTEQGVWTEEVLNTMKLDVLEKLEKTATTKKAGTVYVGGGAGVSGGQATIAPMPLPGVEFEQK